MTMSEERATSFGNVAESYDRVRPAPPAEALDWLVPAPCEVAVDLAAGTGLFTRALLGRAAAVIAVEPDERMRAVLAQRSPRVRVIAGWGEAMPLPDGPCFDALLCRDLTCRAARDRCGGAVAYPAAREHERGVPTRHA